MAQLFEASTMPKKSNSPVAYPCDEISIRKIFRQLFDRISDLETKSPECIRRHNETL